MKYLIFSETKSGHHLEYIIHEIEYALSHPEYNYIFVLSQNYAQEIDKFNLLNHLNIEIDYIPTDITNKWKNLNFIFRSLYICKYIKKSYNKYQPDKIILNELISKIFLPLILIIHKKIIRGILYKIPRRRYRPKISTIIKDWLITQYFINSRSIETIWLLNDPESAKIYNQQFKTSIFKPLVDPINIIPSLNNKIIKSFSFNNKIILFHGGGLGERKGTIDILKALDKIQDHVLHHFIIIIAGKISDKELNLATNYISKLESKMEIIWLNEFISYQDLCSYISISDYILIPYKNVEQSSGILGYAAHYNKPVLGPNEGLLGHLIQIYNLGETIPEMSIQSLKNKLTHLTKKIPIELNTSQYVELNTIQRFCQSIFLDV